MDTKSWNETVTAYDRQAVLSPLLLDRLGFASDQGLLGQAMSASGRPALQLEIGRVSILLHLSPRQRQQSIGQPVLPGFRR